VSGRDGRQKECSFPESIVLDVYAMFRETSPSLGQLGDIGMTTFYFHEVACNANEELGEYLLASTCLRASQNSQDLSSSIIILALRTIFQSTSSWNANEILSGIMVMLKVVASIPDELQKDRIRQIMLFNDRDPPNGSKPLGLLAAASHIYNSRSQQTYQQDMVFAYERYVGLVKELIYLRGVMEWMNEHRQLWSFMERDLLDTHHHPGYRQPRGGYSAPREPDDGGISLDQHHHSDSDGMHGIHDSEEEDEESRVEEMEFYNEGPAAVAITGAGNAAVNGLYVKDGHHDGTFKYSRTGEHQGERAIYSIFKCNVSNNTKHWYISVVPHGAQPGTSSDIDFYSAPVSNESNELPPLSGWVKAHEGTEPLPTLTYRDSTVDESPTAVGYEEWSDDQGINAPTSYV
jgi:ubiquitin carboxyl-terminal hydrolase 9/24